MIKVYVASPYTIGNKEENVMESLRVGNMLIELGFNPYLPLLAHFQHIHFPQSYMTWLNLGLRWLESCDCLLRLPGVSDGADKEVDVAKRSNIPVFYDIQDLLRFYGK